MDSNLQKQYEIFHYSHKKQQDQEKQLHHLRKFVIKWLPNFHKYGFDEGFDEGIRFITEDWILHPSDDDKFWEKQEIEKIVDTDKHMWGIT